MTKFRNCVLLVVAVLAAGCRGGWSGVQVEESTLVTPNGAITHAGDEQRTGWFPDQPGLDPATVAGSSFGRLFKTQLPLKANEQVYAEPLVWAGKVFVATEGNNLYSLDGVTGAILASRALGTPFDPNAAPVSCGDLSPTVGITGTPVIDNATGTAYFFSKTYDAGNNAVWYFHAVDAGTLIERTGFPVQVTGAADNDATVTFNAQLAMQRPGLLLVNGVVYAGFGAHCDKGAYRGWVIGISTSGVIKARFSVEAGAASGAGAGIWMAGGGLVSDGAGQVLFTTGNGYAPNNPWANPIPGNTPPGFLEQSVVRLTVQANGTLKAMDFFAPYDAPGLNGGDQDFGSGGLVALPSQFGTASIPRLAIQSGKKGVLYVLNRDNLGGYQQGANHGDNAVSTTTLDGGTWSRPGVWPGDGGYVYVISAGGTKLQALKYGTNAQGAPALTIVGRSSMTFGSYSGSPIITSNGTAAGSALVWVTDLTSQLRVFKAVPDGTGTLPLVYTDSYGNQSKFTTIGVGAGRVYVGSGDGYVIGYGSTAAPPTSGTALDFGTVVIGQNKTLTATITANQNLTVTAIAPSTSVFTTGASTPALPATLTAGQTITVPVIFTPTASGNVSASLNVTTNVGQGASALSGVGQVNGPNLVAAPGTASFGGVANGTTKTVNVVLTNNGNQTLTFGGYTAPAAPFTVSGIPASGAALAAGASVTISATFAPTATGNYSSSVILNSNSAGGALTALMSGNGGPPPVMVISPANLAFGSVPVGQTVTASFTISNTGGTDLTITKSKPPALGNFIATTTLAEGSVIPAGTSVTETVSFAGNNVGAYSDGWIITGNDSSGVQTVGLTASVVAALSRTGWIATASSSGGADVPGNALDGNAGTRWTTGAAQANGQWFQVDLGSAQSFSALTMDSGGNAGDYAHGYQVFVSNDGATWGNAIATGTGTTQVISVSFATQNARYLRVVQTATSGSWWSVVEFNVYSSAASQGPSALGRAGWIATASSTGGGDVPGNVLDGNVATRWTTGAGQANGQYLQLDMLQTQTFNQIVMDSGGNAGDYAHGYQVFVSGDGTNWGNAVATGTGAAQQITVTFATQTARYLRIVQTSTTPASWWSVVEVNVYTPGSSTPPPAAPTALGATAASSTGINLSWTASTTTGVTYSVFRSTTSGFTPGAGNQIASGLSTTTYADTGLTAQAAYYYVVEAVNAGGASPASNQATATTQAAPPPAAPTNLTATAASSVGINLSWTASTTAGVTYSVFRSTTSGFTPGAANQIATGLATTAYADTGLGASTTYYYVVKAVNGAGSAASNQAPATTQPTPPPAAPTALAATATSTTAINLSWTASTTAGVTYSVFRSTSSTFVPGAGNQIASGLAGTTYGDAGLVASTKYYYYVEAVNAAGASPASNQANATTQAGGGVEAPLSRAGWVITASSSGGGATSNLVDGQAATRWSTGAAQANGQWLQVDLGSQQAFNELQLDSGANNGDYAHGYQVFVSNDGVNWGTAVATGTGSAQLQTIWLGPQSARFIKVVQTATATSWWSVVELNVLGGNDTPPPVALARTGWIATASATGGTDVPANVLDGAAGTRWTTGAAQANGQWLQIDMGTAQTFVQLTMDSGGNATDYAHGYQVFVSNDGTNWGTAVATGAGTAALVTATFPSQTARYIRVVQTSNTPANWWSIVELNVWH